MQNPDILIGLYRTVATEEERQYFQTQFDSMISHFRSLVAAEEARLAQSNLGQFSNVGIGLAQACNQLAWLLANCETHVDEALYLSGRSLEFDPDSYAYLDTMARCCYAAGRLEEAVEYQKRAVGQSPHDRMMKAQLIDFQQALAAGRSAAISGGQWTKSSRGAAEVICQENWRDGKSLAHPSCPSGLCPRLNCSASHRKLAALLVGLVGCLVGCRSGSEDQLSAEQLDKQRQERTADVLANDPVSLPTDSQRAIVTLKPGHWHEVTQKFRSNREDLQVLAVGSVLRGGGPSPLAGTDFVGEFTRRSTLPKEQEKTLALQVFAASGGQAGQNQSSTIAARNRIDLASQLFALPLKTPISGGNRRTAAYELADHEFQLVVLAPEALGYQYLSSLDAIVWAQTDENLVADRIRSYEVCSLTPRNRQYGLPSSLLTMTSVAVIVWDDVIPDELTDDQRQAMLDWLHWGGQLVISGPTSWSRLQSSFYRPICLRPAPP